MEEIIDKKIDGLKIYMKGEMDHYLNLQREGFRDELRVVVDSVIVLGEKVDKVEVRLESVEMRLGKVENRLDRVEHKLGKIDDKIDTYDSMLHRHSKEIQLLKVA